MNNFMNQNKVNLKSIVGNYHLVKIDQISKGNFEKSKYKIVSDNFEFFGLDDNVKIGTIDYETNVTDEFCHDSGYYEDFTIKINLKEMPHNSLPEHIKINYRHEIEDWAKPTIEEEISSRKLGHWKENKSLKNKIDVKNIFN